MGKPVRNHLIPPHLRAPADTEVDVLADLEDDIPTSVRRRDDAAAVLASRQPPPLRPMLEKPASLPPPAPSRTYGMRPPPLPIGRPSAVRPPSPPRRSAPPPPPRPAHRVNAADLPRRDLDDAEPVRTYSSSWDQPSRDVPTHEAIRPLSTFAPPVMTIEERVVVERRPGRTLLWASLAAVAGIAIGVFAHRPIEEALTGGRQGTGAAAAPIAARDGDPWTPTEGEPVAGAPEDASAAAMAEHEALAQEEALDAERDDALAETEPVEMIAAPTVPAPADPYAPAAPVDAAAPTEPVAARPEPAAATPAKPAGPQAATPPSDPASPSPTDEPVGAASGAFDRNAAASALTSAVSTAAACRDPLDPTGTAQVSITFAPSGRVTQATVAGAPYAGTSTGGCIARAFRSLSVAPFTGNPVTVTKSVTIQ